MNPVIEIMSSHQQVRPVVSKAWRDAYIATVGAVAGFLGSVVIMATDIICARILGYAPFMLLRYYATLKEGADALLLSNWTFFMNAFSMHLVIGSALGAIL